MVRLFRSSRKTTKDVLGCSFVFANLINFCLTELKILAFNRWLTVQRCVLDLLNYWCVVTVLLCLGCFEFSQCVFRWVWSSWLFNKRAVNCHLFNAWLFREKLGWLVGKYTLWSNSLRREWVFFLVFVWNITICWLAQIAQELRFANSFRYRLSQLMTGWGLVQIIWDFVSDFQEFTWPIVIA